MTAHKIITLTALLLILGSASAAIIHVDKDATGLNDGSSWANAFTDLNDGLATALSGDEIWLAEGVYKPTTTTDQDLYFEIFDGVKLFGGFNGTETMRSERDWSQHISILSGAIGSQVDITDNSHTIMWADGIDIKIDGIVFQRAYRDLANYNDDQGALNLRWNSEVILRRCTFRNNYAYAGSAVNMWSNCDLAIENCLFRENSNSEGSIVYYGDFCVGRIENCTFAENSWVESYGTNLGGIVNSELEVYNSIIWDDFGHGPFSSIVTTAYNCIVNEFNPGTTFINSLIADPMFINPGGNDFNLQADSPAISFGDNAEATNGFDLNHTARIWNDTVEAGCYEYAQDRIIYVDQDATENNLGNNWDNAFTELQNAITESKDGDQIWVADGIYYPTSSADRTISFEPKDNVPMYGGFSGNETDLNERNWLANETILSGNIGGVLNLSDNSYHVVNFSSKGGDFLFDGFIVQWGNANGSGSNDNGAGFYVSGANSFELSNCWIRNNNAIGPGGGGWILSSITPAEIYNTVFQNNLATGGAALVFNPETRIENCAFLDNDGESIVEANSVGALTMVGCTVYGNTGTSGPLIQGSGGAGDLEGELINSIIWGNTITSGDAVEDDPDFDVSYSILQGNILGAIQEGDEVYYENPQFIDPSSGDFVLCSNSPGHNNGDDSQVMTSTDVLTNTRIVGSNVDMGAVENQDQNQDQVFVLYVDKDATGANDGSTWNDAFTDLQSALANLGCTTEIWVAEGIYKPTTGVDQYAHYLIDQNINIYGGFDGSENNRSQRDWDANVCRLSGQIGNQGDDTDNSYNLVEVSAANLILDGFVLERAFRETSSNNPYRSAIRIMNNGHATARHCVFRNNTAHSGPAISLFEGSADLDNCLVRNNHSDGGGIIGFNNSTSGSITECTITKNDFVQDFGAAISGSSSGSVEIYNTIIWDNDGMNVDGSLAAVADHCLFDFYTASLNDIYTNIISDDPEFTDPSSNDFTLQDTSPAIGFGLNAYSNLNLDQNHETRIWNGTVDLGCFEFFTTDIIYVDADATGDNNGSSWTNAFIDLQDGLAAFTGTEEIWVAEGTYYPTNTADRTISFELISDIELYGGFAGDESARTQRDVLSNTTILSGNIGAIETNTDNTYHVVLADGLLSSSILDGFQIRDGYANGDGALFQSRAAALYVVSNTANDVYINSCDFVDNYASEVGGAITTAGGGECIITESSFSNNTSVDDGGAVQVYNGSFMTLSNCTFDSNYSDSGSALTAFGEIELSECIFSENQSQTGTVIFGYHNFQVYDCEFTLNHASDSSGVASLTSGASVEFHRSHFNLNTASNLGGVMTLWSASALFENCLFDGNSAPEAGVVSANDADISFVNCTLVNNSCDNPPLNGGIIDESSGTNTGLIANCIFRNNTAPADVNTPNLVVQNNIIRNYMSNGNLDCDPNFIDAPVADYQITSNSPAYDSGDNGVSSTATDLNGEDRDMGLAIDMGCYEAQSCAAPHDVCEQAFELTVDDEPKYSNNRCTSIDGDPTTACTVATGRTVWHEFVAPASGSVTVTTSNVQLISVIFNMRMALFEGACGALSEVSCEDSFPFETPEVLVADGLIAGATYFIRVEGVGTQQATWKIQVTDTPSSCPGDYDFDGEINTQDLLIFLTEFGCTSGCTADLDGDDEVNTSDLLIFLTAFGTVCP